MTPLIMSGLELQKFCEDKKWKFCFIGGIALQIWGQQRLTRDLDWDHIEAHLTTLVELSYSPETLTRLQEIKERFYQK